jgi:hypothetical protein
VVHSGGAPPVDTSNDDTIRRQQDQDNIQQTFDTNSGSTLSSSTKTSKC